MCDRFHDLARMDFTGEGARAGISIGYGRPYPLPHAFDLVERHPLGSQAFVPMTEDPFLVVVAPDDGGRPGTPRAFLTRPGQGVNYLRGVWHGVLDPARPGSALPHRRPDRPRQQPRGVPLRHRLDRDSGLRQRPRPRTTAPRSSHSNSPRDATLGDHLVAHVTPRVNSP